jgi:hypothetical protein
MRAAHLLTLLGLWAAPVTSHAEKVKLEVKVVEASTQGNAIDPKLSHMQSDFKHKGFAYSSYKLVSEKDLTADLNAVSAVPLPTGKEVKLTPTGVDKKGKGTKLNMHLEIPGLFDINYSVANGGTYFQGAGANGHGQPNESQVFLAIKHTLVP